MIKNKVFEIKNKIKQATTKINWIIPVTVVVALVSAVSGYSSGPPPDACANMRPGPPHEPNSITASEFKSAPFEVRNF